MAVVSWHEGRPSVVVKKHVTTLMLMVFACLLLAGCGTKRVAEEGFVTLSDREARKVVKSIDLQKQKMGSWHELAVPLSRSLAYVNKKPADAVAISTYGMSLRWSDLRASLEMLYQLLPHLDSRPELLVDHFRFLRLAPGPKFTGYYEPLIDARLAPDDVYKHPIYAKPDDLQTLNMGAFHPRWKGQRLLYRIENGQVVPYFDRAAIDENGKLKGKGLEIAWAKDPVDIFFLQIQGSGRLQLEDDREMHVLYAGKNGKQYVSLGRIMRERGLLAPDNISMQSIREWLSANPEMMQSLLNTNPSYVFFRLSDSGPYGSINEALTPMTSLATDRTVLPLGGAMLFSVPLPEQGEQGEFKQGEVMTGVGFAQDTGGAIKGQRIDLFSGYGPEAEWTAGHMNAPGEVYLLLPRK